MITCPRCQRDVEAGRGKGPGEVYCSIPCAKAASMSSAPARACARCGASLAWLDQRARYCSPRCQREASRDRLAVPVPVPVPALEPRACDWCGEQFTPARQPLARFCSRAHAVAAANARRRDPAALPARPPSQAERLADLEGRRSMTLTGPRFGKYPLISVPEFPAAACRGSWLPPDSWADPAGDDEREAAASVCQTCVHKIECLEFGIAHAGSLAGVWGGLAQKARLRARTRQLARARAGSAA
jgi:endogenous inhibitor of DNA gyrase (YacG/DUF329 family)